MNKQPIAAAIALMTLSGVALAEGPEFYGKANVSVVNQDDGTDREWDATSNASRLGVKGTVDLGEGLEAFYQLEYEVSVDDDDDIFKQRNTFAGLRGGFGEVYTGRVDSLLKTSQGKVDYSSDLAGADIKQVFLGEERFDDVVGYKTPSFGGFTFAAQTFLDQGQDDDSAFAHMSVSANYRAGDLTAAIAYDSETKSDAGFANILRGSVQYTMGNFQVGGMAQTAETADGFDLGDAVMASASYKMDDFRFWGLYASGFQPVGIADGWVDANGETIVDQLSMATAGVDYKLSSAVKTFVYYSAIDAESLTGMEAEENTLGVGLEIKF
ncbi:MAG: porin [Gammaproteobacteria bacterium]|nr:porin [Gammaproteobacteria bacterium]